MKCPLCWEEFGERAGLDGHLRRELGYAAFACTLCPRVFFTKLFQNCWRHLKAAAREHFRGASGRHPDEAFRYTAELDTDAEERLRDLLAQATARAPKASTTRSRVSTPPRESQAPQAQATRSPSRSPQPLTIDTGDEEEAELGLVEEAGGSSRSASLATTSSATEESWAEGPTFVRAIEELSDDEAFAATSFAFREDAVEDQEVLGPHGDLLGRHRLAKRRPTATESQEEWRRRRGERAGLSWNRRDPGAEREPSPDPGVDDGRIRCFKCHMRVSKIDLKRHAVDRHMDAFQFFCRFCDYKTKRKGNLRSHQEKIHKTILSAETMREVDLSEDIRQTLDHCFGHARISSASYRRSLCQRCEMPVISCMKKRHVAIRHLCAAVHSCLLCDFVSPQLGTSDIARHMREKHQTEVWSETVRSEVDKFMPAVDRLVSLYFKD